MSSSIKRWDTEYHLYGEYIKDLIKQFAQNSNLTDNEKPKW